MIRDGKAINHSGNGGFWGNLIVTLVLFVAFCGSLFAMGYWALGPAWSNAWAPGLIALGLAVITFIVPKNVLGRGDTLEKNDIHRVQTAPVSTHH